MAIDPVAANGELPPTGTDTVRPLTVAATDVSGWVLADEGPVGLPLQPAAVSAAAAAATQPAAQNSRRVGVENFSILFTMSPRQVTNERTLRATARSVTSAQDLAVGIRSLMRSVWHVLTPVASGMLLGVIIAMPVGRALRAEPFYLQNVDPIAFLSAVVMLILAGAIAALWPALRMLRSNPVEALRHS
jgi:ABC-type sugar transport system permease subunit